MIRVDLLTNLFTDVTVLTPLTVIELFVFFSIIELIGMFFSWVKGGR